MSISFPNPTITAKIFFLCFRRLGNCRHTKTGGIFAAGFFNTCPKENTYEHETEEPVMFAKETNTKLINMRRHKKILLPYTSHKRLLIFKPSLPDNVILPETFILMNKA